MRLDDSPYVVYKDPSRAVEHPIPLQKYLVKREEYEILDSEFNEVGQLIPGVNIFFLPK